MESPGHRKNVMNPNFTHIGIGFVENGYCWTHIFSNHKSNIKLSLVLFELRDFFRVWC